MQFDQNNYKRSFWTASIVNLEVDEYKPRLIIRVATGRKYWPFLSEILSIESGENDPLISAVNRQLYGYTHPMIDRFITELELMLSDIYKIKIKLQKPKL
jgi:hypothetical protein